MLERQQVKKPEERMMKIVRKVRGIPSFYILSFEEVFQITKILHEGQIRKNGEPYITHLLAACEILIFDFEIKDMEMIQTILLHDSIEDQQERLCKSAELENTRENAIFAIKRIFGKDVADWVSILNKVKIEKTASDIEKLVRDGNYIDGILKNPKTVILKLADLLHNLEDICTITDHSERIRMSKKYLPTLKNFERVLTSEEIFENQSVQMSVLQRVVDYKKEIEEYLSNGAIL